MGENTPIEWAKDTFNPWSGCTAVSAACDHCFAEAWSKRYKKTFGQWGPHAPRKRTSEANWKKPLAWNRKAEREGRRTTVFCASMADVFDNHKSIEQSWRDDLWALIRATPNLDWMLLTKRPQNMARFLPADWGSGYPNVGLGTTVENQDELARRGSILVDTPAAWRFFSCEPLLSPLYGLPEYLGVWWNCTLDKWIKSKKHSPKIDWVIVGGESGPGARPMHVEWARSIRDQCEAAGVPFFFKQWGEWDWVETSEGVGARKIGKKAAGRLLDGVEHSAWPERIS